jgi:hypothetical protein
LAGGTISGKTLLQTAPLTNPADGTLHIVNPGTSDSTVTIIAEISTSRHLTITPLSQTVNKGDRVSFTVSVNEPGASEAATAYLIDPSGAKTPITLTATGTGAWTGQATVAASGTNKIEAQTTGDRPRYAEAGVSVASGKVTIAPGFTEQLVDTDHDGLADSLLLTITVTATAPGDYSLGSDLVSSTGEEIDTAGADVHLVAGTQQVPIDFVGQAIYNAGISGPYRLVNLRITDTTDGAVEAAAAGMGLTQAYNYKVFQHFPVLIDRTSVAMVPIDSNGNGLYERLDLSGNVTVDTGGAYRVVAGLTAPDGSQVARTSAVIQLNAGTNSFTTSFGGSEIWTSGKDGPYVVDGLTVYKDSDASVTDVVDAAATSPAYTYDQFSPPTPTSAVAPTINTATPTPQLSIPFTATFPGGAGSVEVWQRYTPDGGTAGAWELLSSGSQSPLSVTLTHGEGSYELHTRAIDALGQYEPQRETADATVIYSTTLPSSSVGALPPLVTVRAATLPFSVVDHGAGVQKVKFYYRCRAAGSVDWPAWGYLGETSNLSSSFVGGEPYGCWDGPIEFYSVAVDNLGRQEPAPLVADASTLVDTTTPSSSLALPSRVSSVNLQVPFATSDFGGSGVTSVELWERGPSSSYQMVASGTTSPFFAQLNQGPGQYDFYAISVDAAGHREAPPQVWDWMCNCYDPGADATTILDPTVPQLGSAILPLASTTITSSQVSLQYWAAYPSGSGVVQLWQRTKLVGDSSFGPWWMALTTSTWPINLALLADGQYEFYTVAVDSVAGQEDPPGAADVSVLLDRTPPTSTISLPPGTVTTSSYELGCGATDAGSGVASTTLYYRWSPTPDGFPPTWTSIGTCGASGTLTFSFPKGEGYYQFAASSIDLAGNAEAAPTLAMASTDFEPAPDSHVDPLGIARQGGRVCMTVTSNAPYELWENYAPPGSSVFSGWIEVGSGEPGQNVCYQLGSDGRYEFRSIAVMRTGVREAPPSSADTWVISDTVAPTSAIGQVVARTSSPTIAVPFTASDGNGSGVATMYVYTRYRANQDATWSSWNGLTTVSMPATSADIPLTSGQGFYQVALAARDQAGNYEQWPPTQVAGTHYTTGNDPSSSVGALPVGTNKTPLNVPYSADFASGSGQVELWESSAPAGSSTYTTPVPVATVTAPDPLVAALAGGEGSSYRFYTIAIDGQSGVREAAPASPDASIILDTVAPTSTLMAWPTYTTYLNTGNDAEVSDDDSGVAKLDVYYRVAPPGTSNFGPWQLLSTHLNPVSPVFYVPTFASCVSDCDGTYQFTSVATDFAGNVEAGPGEPQAWTMIDSVRPTSSPSPLAPLVKSNSVSITYSATDDSSGVGGVDIYERFQAAGSPDWSGWSFVRTSGTTSPRTVYLLNGDGRYEFYTNAWDNCGNGELPPATAETFTVLDRTAPTTSVTSLPAHISSPSQTIAYAAEDGDGSGVQTLQIQRQFKGSGGYFGAWSTLSTVNDPASSGTAALTLADGYGTYHFRTIATDYAGNTTTSTTTTDTVLDAPVLATQAGPLPAAVKSTSLPVPYTVTSGTATSIQLYQRWTTPGGNPSGGYTQVASKPSPGTSGTFTVTLSKGPGLYEFYTQGVGSSGTEPAPTSADASTILDTTAPTSQASAVTTSRNTNTVTITFGANDNPNGSGLASVDLYQRFTAPGQSAGSYSKIVPGATSPVTVTLTTEGKYEFYTLATDKANNAEAAPSSPDAYTVYDVTAPISRATPAAGVHSTTLSVPFTATDTNGSGVSSVQLYERYTTLGGTPSGSFTTVGSPTTTSPISVTLGSVGRYEFYTRATDAASNLEAAPTSGYATTIYETTAPTSQAGSLPALINGTSLSVPFTAADEPNGSGIGSVTLYVSYEAPGSTSWSSYSSIGSPATGTSGSFNVTLTSGSGSYRFYTRATDVAGNTEAAPSTADATTVLDNVAPTSSITAPPSTSSASSISLTYSASDNTNGSGFQSVEFWYRYRTNDGATPGAWTAGGTSTAASGSFTLTFGSGAGIYDILTVAIDKAGNREGAIANPPAAGATPKSYVRSISWAAGAKVNTDTGTALQDNASYAVGSDGTVYAVWEDSRNGNTDIYFSSRNPTTGVWAAETKLNADTGSAGQRTPSIAIDGSGNLYVVWADDRNGSTNTDIYFAKRTGTTWSANIKVNSDTGTAVQSNPRISVSSAGIAVAVWYDARSSQVNIYSARLPAGSTTWSTNYKVTSNTSAVKAAPDVAVATDGTAWAAWQDNQTGGGDIYIASLGPSATTWSTNTKVSDDSGSSSLDKSPRIGLTSANLPLVAYLDGRTTNAQVRVVNRTSGGTWNASVQASDSSAKPATGLALAVKADGGVIVAWDDTRSTSAIWGAQCEAGSGTSSVTRCGPAEKWSDQAGASSHPSITASATQVYLGWRDDTAGGGDIRIRLRNPS